MPCHVLTVPREAAVLDGVGGPPHESVGELVEVVGARLGKCDRTERGGPPERVRVPVEGRVRFARVVGVVGLRGSWFLRVKVGEDGVSVGVGDGVSTLDFRAFMS